MWNLRKMSAYSAHTDNFYFYFFYGLSKWHNNFSWFHKIPYQKDAENFSCLSWQTKKFYSKKYMSWAKSEFVSISKQPALFIDPILEWRFWISLENFFTFCLLCCGAGLKVLQITNCNWHSIKWSLPPWPSFLLGWIKQVSSYPWSRSWRILKKYKR